MLAASLVQFQVETLSQGNKGKKDIWERFHVAKGRRNYVTTLKSQIILQAELVIILNRNRMILMLKIVSEVGSVGPTPMGMTQVPDNDRVKVSRLARGFIDWMGCGDLHNVNFNSN